MVVQEAEGYSHEIRQNEVENSRKSVNRFWKYKWALLTLGGLTGSGSDSVIGCVSSSLQFSSVELSVNQINKELNKAKSNKRWYFQF